MRARQSKSGRGSVARLVRKRLRLDPIGLAHASPSKAKAAVGSVPALVHQRLGLDPRHHLAQLLADLLDRMLGELGAGRLERSLVDLVLEHPVARELAGLDV